MNKFDSYFLSRINDNDYKVLTDKEEIKIFKDFEHNKNIKNKIICHNLKLILNIAQKYSTNNIPLDNLISYGIEGINIAIEKYDYKKGYKFSTYATFWIETYMKNGIRNEKNIIKIPLSTIRDAKVYYKEYYNILKERNYKPNDDEIIRKTKLNKRQIELIKKIPTEIISVEKTIDDNEDLTINDTIYNNENYNEFENIEETEKLLSIINNISKDENVNEILLMYWGINKKEPLTMEEIGKIYNISRQAISKKIKKIVKQIKKYY